MSGAIWNTTKVLAETSPISAAKRAGLARIERNEQNRERAKNEPAQLDWRPTPGRAPYAGWEDEE